MAFIWETKNFTVESHDAPEIGRQDGGHLVIHPKIKVEDRTKLDPELIIELGLLTSLAGKAMKDGLAQRGIKLGRINYQDNGNWKPELHVHLYGRALDAKVHPFGHPFKAAWTLAEKISYEPLDSEDIKQIRLYFEKHIELPGYANLKNS